MQRNFQSTGFSQHWKALFNMGKLKSWLNKRAQRHGFFETHYENTKSSTDLAQREEDFGRLREHAHPKNTFKESPTMHSNGQNTRAMPKPTTLRNSRNQQKTKSGLIYGRIENRASAFETSNTRSKRQTRPDHRFILFRRRHLTLVKTIR
jgi:hypothetical protein